MPCSAISSTNLAGSQMSCRTPVAPFWTGSRAPYRKPVRWARVEAMWITLSLVMPPARQRVVGRDHGVVRVHDALGLAGGARAEDEQCHLVGVRTQLGQLGRVAPLLPGGGHELGPGHLLAGVAVQDQHVLQSGPAAAQLADHGQVVEAAEFTGHHDELRGRQPHHEGDLPLTVDRDERVADRADAGDRVVQDDPLDPVRQLEGDHVAGLDAQLEQAQCAAVHLLAQLTVADPAAGVGEGHLVRRPGCDLVQIVGDDFPGPVARFGVGIDPVLGEQRLERHWQAPLQLIVKGSAHGEAAADADGLSSNVTRLVAGQEGHHVGQVLRLPQTAERYRPDQRVPQLGVVATD